MKNEHAVLFSDNAREVIDYLQTLAHDARYVFRGYNKQDELFPIIIRDKTTFDDVEKELLCDFERYGSHYFHANTPIDFLSYAQHFGLPTRLLDFTHNPFIALSFALYNPKYNGNYANSEDKNYYYIRCAAIDENIYIHSISLKDDIYNTSFSRTDSLATKALQCIDNIQDLFGKNIFHRGADSLDGYMRTLLESAERERKIKNHCMLLIDPNQANQRIIMQQGLFMLPYTLDRDEHLSIITKNTSLIMIHKDLRKELLSFLDTMGFTSFRLMPDLASVCTAVKRKVLDVRSEKSDAFKRKKGVSKDTTV